MADTNSFRFKLKIENFKGEIYATDVVLGGSSTTEAKIDRFYFGVQSRVSYEINIKNKSTSYHSINFIYV